MLFRRELNVKIKTIKELGGNIGEYLSHLYLAKSF